MTVDFNKWTESEDHSVKGYNITLLSVNNNAEAITQLAETIPDHFASQYSTILKRLGKPRAAAYLSEKLPTTKQIKSGDLGEIIATEYINAHTNFETPIRRLRWKDHRNMSMRGDDAIGVYFPDNNGEDIAFLKVEAKSAQTLSQGTVDEARKALDNYEGRPSPHSLTFIADRLYKIGETKKGDYIILFQTSVDIRDDQVEHMLFTYSANSPENFLKSDQVSYKSGYCQNTVGVHANSHTRIINDVFFLAGGEE